MTEAIRGTGRLPGGVRLPVRKRDSTAMPIRAAALPPQLILPLHEGPLHQGRPVVRVGQRVLRGQPLLEPGPGLKTMVHASTSGRVRAIEPRPVAGLNSSQALCAVIDSDGEDESLPVQVPDSARWDTPEKLAAALAEAGLAGLGGALYPTGAKLAAGRRRGLSVLIVNAAECEPYISCDDMLIRERAEDVIRGTLWILRLTGCTRAIMALEDDKPQALAALESAVLRLEAAAQLSIVTVPTIYPSGGERQLIALITGEEVPSGGYPPDIGYLCQNVATVAALARFMDTGQALISRIVTVTGGGVMHPCNMDVRLGTPVIDLIDACGGYLPGTTRLIMGGGMTGIALRSDSVPVTRATNCIVAATAEEVRSDTGEMPCIRCGDCADACPARLMPQLLNWSGARHDVATLTALNLFDCIECGCCDVVCPSRIPLTEHFRAAKRHVRQAQQARTRALHAKARHAARQQRLEDQRVAREAALARKRLAVTDPAAAAAAISDILRRAKRNADTDGDTGPGKETDEQS